MSVTQPLSWPNHKDAWHQWRSAMTSARMHHGWILAGKKGFGKHDFALAAARELVAEGGVAQPPGDHPDGRRDRLAQRGGRRRRRLLRHRTPLTHRQPRCAQSSTGQPGGKSSTCLSCSLVSFLRALVESRSPKTVPRVRSVSCCRQRASSPVPSKETGEPSSP